MYVLDETKVAEGNVTIIASLENKEIDKNRIEKVHIYLPSDFYDKDDEDEF